MIKQEYRTNINSMLFVSGPYISESHAIQASEVKEAVKRFLEKGGEVEVLPSFDSKPLPLYRDSSQMKTEGQKNRKRNITTVQRDPRPPISLAKQREHFQKLRDREEQEEIIQRLKLKESFAGLPEETVNLILSYAEQLMTDRQISIRVRIPTKIVRNVLMYNGITPPRTREEAVKLHKQMMAGLKSA